MSSYIRRDARLTEWQKLERTILKESMNSATSFNWHTIRCDTCVTLERIVEEEDNAKQN